ncbi:hypothetical protein ABW20_dc0107406 [Dactylellina cionopaga]|nr:hypothetical protein ABW20_dc0107406 [Dactylellina cionopaga]
MADRLKQLQSHLGPISGNYPSGMFAGQTAIVTGSGQGIGAECVKLFAKDGAKVVVCDIDQAKADAVAKEINESGGKAIAVAGDVTSQLDLLGMLAIIHKMSDKQFDAMIAVHNKAPFMLLRAAAPYFRVTDGESRTVTTISSTTGVHGNAGQLNYSIAKSGVTGMAKTIAKEWGPKYGVRANSVAYGYIQTRLTAAKESGGFAVFGNEKVAIGIPGAGPAGGAVKEIPLQRGGTPLEAAGAIVALASPLMSYVTGHVLMVTGGRNM